MAADPDDDDTPLRPDRYELRRQGLEAAELHAEAAALKARLDSLQLGGRLTAPMQLDEIAAAAEAKDRARTGRVEDAEAAGAPGLTVEEWALNGRPPAPGRTDTPISGLGTIQFEELSGPGGSDAERPGAPRTRHLELLPLLLLLVAFGLVIAIARPTGVVPVEPRRIGATATSLSDLAVNTATPPVTISATTATLRTQGALVVVQQQIELTYASADAVPLSRAPTSALSLRQVPADATTTNVVLPRPAVRDVVARVDGVPAPVVAAGGTWTVRLPDGRLPNALTLDYTLTGTIGAGDSFGLVVPLELSGVQRSAPFTWRAEDAEVVGLNCPYLDVSHCSEADGDTRLAVIPAGQNPTALIAVDRP